MSTITTKNRTFTNLDADTWDVLVQMAQKGGTVDDHPVTGPPWSVQMSNQSLGALLNTNRRLASARAKRLIEFGMVTAIYGDKNGLPSAKKYVISTEWLDRSPKVGDYYPVEVT
tara:strand:- start:898 stop:1239 length:342 start_codon:yes stop_codon:yes gene_type:complete